jgi:hypothetical protein
MTCSGKKGEVGGGEVLNMVVGAFVAFVLIGLPLAIIGLFIASTLERRGGRPPEGFAAESSTSASAMNHGGDRRRRIIYGRHIVGTTASAERHRPMRLHGGNA